VAKKQQAYEADRKLLVYMMQACLPWPRVAEAGAVLSHASAVHTSYFSKYSKTE
jgi:hypothetical protein